MPLQTWKDYAEAAEQEGGTSVPIGPLPDGKYNFRVIESEYRVLPTGSQGLSTNCVVEDGPFKGKRQYKTFWIAGASPTSLNILFRQLNALGITKEWIYQLPEDMEQANHLLAAELIGRRFVGTVGRDNRKPEYADIKYVDPPLSGPVKVEGAAVPSPTPTPSYPTAPTPTPNVPVAAPVAPAAAPAPAPAAPAPSAAPTAPAAPWVPQTAPAAAPTTDDPWDATPPPAPVF